MAPEPVEEEVEAEPAEEVEAEPEEEVDDGGCPASATPVIPGPRAKPKELEIKTNPLTTEIPLERGRARRRAAFTVLSSGTRVTIVPLPLAKKGENRCSTWNFCEHGRTSAVGTATRAGGTDRSRTSLQTCPSVSIHGQLVHPSR
jgi:hypothetical protein